MMGAIPDPAAALPPKGLCTMRLFPSVFVVFLAVLPTPGRAEAAANTLTPKEIADGWILLFDGETTFGWRVDGDARVENGVLVLGGAKETTATTTTAFPNWCCSFDMEMRWEGTKSPWFELPGSLNGHLPDSVKIKFVRQAIHHTRPPERFPVPPPEPWKFQVPAGSKLFLRNVKLHPVNTKLLFNGKDLTGWKEFPGRKSKFSVEDGILTIKNGPGDLQTEGQWADFVLQLECRSNGKHLNSGVFFRCRPDEYQQGYEAQIHNAFSDEPKKEYTLEDYDPETHKLLRKRKERYTALDYGTGAIYRRQPARKQVSRDNEWFTMTVVAGGRHLAVWVNGVEVTDWTDNRPPSDNARNGCRLEAGPISLQGHDPTTDLSFRNLRILDLPAAK
jgi:hypothetical protein